MTCGSSEPLATIGDRRCPFATVATRTQRGPGLKPTSSVGEVTRLLGRLVMMSKGGRR
jgi:hypothetical protein